MLTAKSVFRENSYGCSMDIFNPDNTCLQLLLLYTYINYWTTVVSFTIFGQTVVFCSLYYFDQHQGVTQHIIWNGGKDGILRRYEYHIGLTNDEDVNSNWNTT